MLDFYQQYPPVPIMEPTPDATIGRQVARSGVWSAGGQVVVLAASLVATPFTIRLLGPSAYGLLALVNAVIAYVTVLDLGMGAASTRFGSQAFARGDDRGEAAVVWTATVIAAVPTTLLAALLALFAEPLVRDVLQVDADLVDAATIAVRLGAIALLARVVAAVLSTSEQVRLRWDLYVGINTAGSLLQIGMIPVLLGFGHGVVAAVSVVAAVAVAVTVSHLVVAARLQPQLTAPTVERRLLRPLLGFGGALVAANGLALVLGNAERFLLARYESIAAVGAYAVASTIAALLSVLPIAVSQPMLPAFARLGATGDWAVVGRLYRRGIVYILVASLPAATLIAVVGRPFLRLWAGEQYGHASSGPLWILLVGIVINAVAFLPYNLLLALGATRAVAVCHLIELPLFVVYAPLLVIRFGAAGAAAAWTLRLALGAGLFFRVAAARVPAALPPSGVAPVARASSVLAVPLAVLAATGHDALAAAVLVPALLVYAWLARNGVLDADERDRIAALVRRFAPGRGRGADDRRR